MLIDQKTPSIAAMQLQLRQKQDQLHLPITFRFLDANNCNLMPLCQNELYKIYEHAFISLISAAKQKPVLCMSMSLLYYF